MLDFSPMAHVGQVLSRVVEVLRLELRNARALPQPILGKPPCPASSTWRNIVLQASSKSDPDM
jgi:hypothetical protein